MKIQGKEWTDCPACGKKLGAEAYCSSISFHGIRFPMVFCPDCWDFARKNIRYVLKFETVAYLGDGSVVEEAYAWDPIFYQWEKIGIYRWRM